VGHPLARGPGLALAALVLLLLLAPAPAGAHALTGAVSALLQERAAPAHPAAPTPAFNTPPPGPFDWATFHGADNRSGFTPVHGPGGPTDVWTPVTVSSLPVRAGPVVNSTAIFVSDIVGNVRALSRANGSTLWTATIWSNPTTPTLAGGLLYFGCSNGEIYALNSSTGRTVWTSHLGTAIIQGSLDVANELLVTTGGGALEALNDSTGASLWSLPLGAPGAGAPAEENGTVYAVDTSGRVLAATLAGAPVWSAALNRTPVDTALAAAGPALYVASTDGNVSALDANNGSLRWSFSTAGYPGGGSIDAPVASDGHVVDWISYNGGIFSVNASNGSLRWVSNGSVPGSSGYPLLSAPALTPNGLYLIDGSETLDDVSPSTGAIIWSYPYGGLTVFSSPAVVADGLVIGTDDGVVDYFGSPTSLENWPVSGLTVSPNGTPLANITVELLSRITLSAANGSFTLYAPNGSYLLLASGETTELTRLPITVTGPLLGLRVVLRPLTLYVISGRLIDGDSALPVAGGQVVLTGSGGYQVNTTSGPDGGFLLSAPNGSVFLTVGGLVNFAGVSERFPVQGAPITGLVVELAPLALAVTLYPGSYAVPILFGAVGAGALVAWLAEVSRRRREQGLSGRLLSPFGRYVLMRVGLIPVQLFSLLALLFVFGTFLPNIAITKPPAVDWYHTLSTFFDGLGYFAYSMVSGNWGYASYGHLSEPVAQYIAWWLPYSIELMVFALGLSAVLGYLIGLRAGWRSEGLFDYGTRFASLLGLLLPSFLVILVVLGGLYGSFSNYFGDTPYGILPNLHWYDAHGGNPPGWIGLGSNTLPTGFPLIDSAYHGDWPFFDLVLAKTLFQAALIALVYVAIFLRYARHAAAEHAQALSVVAARSRGVPEHRLLWYHTGRRALPEFVLLFAITLPVYIGTQAVAEALFSDTGIGTVLLTEMTQVASSGFGISHGVAPSGNLYQVAILFLFLAVLFGNLLADITARYLDPRLLSEGR
jgi:ABC-type dipeptide/oligopeptide/nickel transport system permease component/outer membrane protein assembly factor BamB